MASHQGRQGLLVLLVLLLGQACTSCGAADSSSREDTILVKYSKQSRQQVGFQASALVNTKRQ
jgi:hypothetical protein